MKISASACATQLLLSAVLVSAGVLSGCSEFRDDWGDETTQATAVGGAMGAGLGAIIGSQTGSAGAGLVLGGIAGAGAGAAIGTSLQERSNNLRAQEELIERQGQRIAANRKSLEQLSNSRDSSLSDQLAYQRSANFTNAEQINVSQRGASSIAPFESPAVSGTARLGSTADAGRARYGDGTISQGRNSVSGAQLSRSTLASNTPPVAAQRSAAFNSPPAGALLEREIAPRGSSANSDTSGSSALNQAVVNRGEGATGIAGSVIHSSVIHSSVIHSSDIPGAGINGTGVSTSETENTVSNQPHLNPPATGAIVSGLQPPAALDDDCLVADGELNLAAKASAAADKLFHQRKALRLCPNGARYHVAIADTYASLNRNSDAEFELREALKLEPQNAAAQSKLQELK